MNAAEARARAEKFARIKDGMKRRAEDAQRFLTDGDKSPFQTGMALSFWMDEQKRAESQARLFYEAEECAAQLADELEEAYHRGIEEDLQS